MKLYYAPLEGITGYILRNAFHDYFGGIDKYYIPFIKSNQFGKLSAREKNDIMPEHNQGMKAVPQIMTNSSKDFLMTVDKLQQYGYEEVNLNLGCPSKTVVTKKRGSGFLAYPDELNRFLEEIYTHSKLRISVKTRIGMEDPKEFEQLLDIYNQYPIEELIIHPRVQKDFYKNTPNMEVFQEAVQKSKNVLCYNGDINTKADYQRFCENYPMIDRVMIGRGLLMNPALALEITEGKGLKKEELKKYHDQILAGYLEIMFGEKPVLHKMKELWTFMAPLFTNYEKYAKKIRKSEKVIVYEEVVEKLFAEQKLQ